MKRALSFILALTLAFALFPTFAYASTTEETPYNWEPVVFDFGSPTTPATVTNGEILKNDGAYDGDKWKFVLFKGRSTVLNANARVKTFSNSNGKYIWIGASAEMVNENNNIFAIAVDVPASGIYDISANVFNTSAGAEIVAAIQNQPNGTLNLETAIGEIENTYTKNDDNDKSGKIERVFSEGVGIAVAKTENFATAGHSAWIDNLIKLTIKQDAGYNCYLYDITFTPSTINSATVTIDTETEYEIGAVITPTVSLNVEGIGNKVYDDLDMAGIVLGVEEDNAGVMVENNVYKATASGEVTFTPTVTVNGQTHEAAPVTITVASNEPEEDATLTNEFIQETDKEALATYIAPTVTGTDFTGKVFTAEKNTDGTFTLTAPEKNSDNEAFLYWAKGMETKKRIISFNNIITDYVPAEEGRNYLIAVYEGDIEDTTTPEYYNLNGQLIAKANTEPAYPSIPGLGTAEGWEPCGGNIFVAKYASTTRKAVIITAGDNCTLDKDAYAYGDLVTCTATGEGKFKCWKKNGEIVSVDEAYSFNVWEDCNVEAVYENYTYNGSNMNILIDSFTVDAGVTGVMAEFIGFENEDVIEKGIKFTDSKNNEIKIPMTTTANQLAVIADAGKYEGYAILRSGNAYQMITDGSYEHN